ncbi:MAG: ABC transporter substrate-binding protein [Candidatus Eiseniibacteriota bacterium]|jgi:peptide/nickel transport system substrate-binding protein
MPFAARRIVPSTPIRTVITLLCLASVTLLASCGGSGSDQGGGGDQGPLVDGVYDPARDPLVNPPSMFEPAPDDTSLINYEDVLVRNLSGNPNSLNPLFISSTVEFYVVGAMFDGPFTFGPDLKFAVNEDITESFEESSDHTVYTIKLRPGLKWHDGHPYTAHDIVFSWQQILDDRVPCPAVRSGTDDIIECEALDDLTVRMVHRDALATNPWNATFPIIPKHIYEKDKDANPDLKSGEYYNAQNRHPIGSGPYRIVEWRENDKIVLERWEDYHGEKPRFKRMVFRIIPDQNILMLTFNKQEIDEFRMNPKQFATQSLPGSDFAKVGQKVLAPQWTFLYIGWNMDGSNPFFDDVRVRHAMTHGLDVPRIIRDLAYNLYTPCYGIYHPDSWMYNPEVKRLEFDLDRASELLDEAGWLIDEEREGWRHKVIGGKPVKFEFTLQIPQGADISRDIAAIYQEDLRSIGISMKTQILEWATLVERNRKHEFQATIAAWGTGTDPDTGRNIWLSSQYDPEGRFGRNYVGFMDERVDELFELGRREFDFEKRRKYYQEIHKRIYDAQPYTFVYNRGTFWALHKRIRGVTTSPRGIFNFNPAENAWWSMAE